MTWPGWEKFVPPAQATPTARKSKYGAEPTTVDGLRFDSKREAARYQVLKLRMQAGEIRRLECQPHYRLCAFGVAKSNARTCVEVAEYVADFEYEEREIHTQVDGLVLERWTRVVEDVKGARTDVYKLKKRWFESQYAVTIRET